MPETTTRFSDWLKEHNNGVLDVELTETLDECVRAVKATDKAGTITLVIKITNEGDMVAVIDEIKTKLPEIREPRLYWPSLDGGLTRRNPLQPSLLEEDSQ